LIELSLGFLARVPKVDEVAHPLTPDGNREILAPGPV
jgi:hypothetical protein